MGPLKFFLLQILDFNLTLDLSRVTNAKVEDLINIFFLLKIDLRINGRTLRLVEGGVVCKISYLSDKEMYKQGLKVKGEEVTKKEGKAI